MVVVDGVIAGNLWNHGIIGWSISKAEGRFGGLVILWKEQNIDVVLSFKRLGFLGIKVWWKDRFYYFVNVYSPCSLSGKKLLLKEVLKLRDKFTDREWLMGGDFNTER